MITNRRISVCALGALAGLALCPSAKAQVRLVPASFTQAGSPVMSTAVRRVAGFDSAAPLSLGSWVELHAGRFVAERPPAILVKSATGTALWDVAVSPLRASLASDLRPSPLPAPMVEPMTALGSVQRLPLTVGTVSALGHFSDRRTIEHALGARGQGRVYRIGVKLDF